MQKFCEKKCVNFKSKGREILNTLNIALQSKDFFAQFIVAHGFRGIFRFPKIFSEKT